MIVFARTKSADRDARREAARPRLLGGRDQRRRRAGAARAHRRTSCGRAGSTSSWRPTSRPAASTSSASATSSTTTSRPTRSPTCTASAAPVAPAGRGDAISFVTPRERRLLTAIEKATRQPLTQMQLPSVEDVNATRLARFDDAITAALDQTDRIDGFRDIIGHYVRAPRRPRGRRRRGARRRRPGRDAAAARARTRPSAPRRERDDRGDRGDRPAGDRDDRAERASARARPSAGPMATYRIAVGQAPQGRAAPDRRRPRQRGRPVSRGDFGAHRRSAPTSRSSSCRPTCRARRCDALATPGSSGKLIELRPAPNSPAQRSDGGACRRTRSADRH